MQNMGNEWESIKQLIFVVSIAMFGALAKTLIMDKKEHITFARVFTGMLVGGFAGLMTYCLVDGLSLGEQVKAFIYGMSGFSGQAVLQFYEERILLFLNHFVAE